MNELTTCFNKIFLEFFQPSAPLPHPGTSATGIEDIKQRKAVFVLDSELQFRNMDY
jgi:hypothetical protein